jgi:hypothetical protein
MEIDSDGAHPIQANSTFPHADCIEAFDIIRPNLEPTPAALLSPFSPGRGPLRVSRSSSLLCRIRFRGLFNLEAILMNRGLS